MRARAAWAFVAGVLGGCGGSDATLVVLGNVRPDASCAYAASPTAPMYAVGTLDLAFERPYVAHVLIENGGSDDVDLNDGWRNVWREPAHSQVISGRGDPARDDLIVHGVTIPAGSRKIVEVDVLGPARVRFRRDIEDVIAHGGAPEDRDTTTVITFEGEAGGDTIKSEPWTYGITVGMGRLVDFPPGTDSAAVAGQDCCATVVSTSCAPGQDDQRGSCSECAGCWPETCNFGQNPVCGGAVVPGCGQ